MTLTHIDPLARRQLGKSTLRVTQLGIGTAPLGDLYQRVPEPDARGMLEAAYDLGLRLFDTAPLYGSGLAEHRTGGVQTQQVRSGAETGDLPHTGRNNHGVPSEFIAGMHVGQVDLYRR